MSHSDPVADMLTRIRNALQAGHDEVQVPSSRLKCAIADVLVKEGYIESFSTESEGSRSVLNIALKYFNGTRVIRGIQRVSKPSLRVYKAVKELPKVSGGYGIAIISTPKGVVSNREAKRIGQGGEVLCYVW